MKDENRAKLEVDAVLSSAMLDPDAGQFHARVYAKDALGNQWLAYECRYPNPDLLGAARALVELLESKLGEQPDGG